jgi:hypothetical protein
MKTTKNRGTKTRGRKEVEMKTTKNRGTKTRGRKEVEMKTTKNGGTKTRGRKATEKQEARATCLLDGAVAPKEMAWLGSPRTILDHIHDAFDGMKGMLDEFDEDADRVDEVAANDSGLMPVVVSLRELCPSVRESLDGVIAAASGNGQPEQRVVEQVWTALGQMHSVTKVLNARTQAAWMEIDNIMDDEEFNPSWLVTMSNVGGSLCSAVAVGYAALTVAKLRLRSFRRRRRAT